jgi:hypothetical protein
MKLLTYYFIVSDYNGLSRSLVTWKKTRLKIWLKEDGRERYIHKLLEIDAECEDICVPYECSVKCTHCRGHSKKSYGLGDVFWYISKSIFLGIPVITQWDQVKMPKAVEVTTIYWTWSSPGLIWLPVLHGPIQTLMLSPMITSFLVDQTAIQY